MKKRIGIIMSLLALLTNLFFVSMFNFSYATTGEEWNERVNDTVNTMVENLEYSRGTESWHQTVGYGNVTEGAGAQESFDCANDIANGGVIFDTTGAWNYPTAETMETTGVKNEVTGTFSPEVTQYILENNIKVELNYYERNDKTAEQWTNETGGIDGESLAAFYYGDGWNDLSSAEKQAYIKELGTNHPVNEDGTFSFVLSDGMDSGKFAGQSFVLKSANIKNFS